MVDSLTAAVQRLTLEVSRLSSGGVKPVAGDQKASVPTLVDTEGTTELRVGCPFCHLVFLTKNQLKKHRQKSHPGLLTAQQQQKVRETSVLGPAFMEVTPAKAPAQPVIEAEDNSASSAGTGQREQLKPEVAAHLCTVLGLENPTKPFSDMSKDEKKAAQRRCALPRWAISGTLRFGESFIDDIREGRVDGKSFNAFVSARETPQVKDLRTSIQKKWKTLKDSNADVGLYYNAPTAKGRRFFRNWQKLRDQARKALGSSQNIVPNSAKKYEVGIGSERPKAASPSFGVDQRKLDFVEMMWKLLAPQ
jgi:uncharacterized C2H2 Zn-finger protein